MNTHLLHRRKALTILGGACATAFATPCLTLNPAMEEGPFFIEEKLLRSDVRTDPTTGAVQPGVLLTLAVVIQNQSGGICAPLAGAHVDIWQASAGGLYSDEAQENTTGQKFLRGYQITDDTGLVSFATVYPGWYSGRTVHIHLRVRTYSGSTVLADFETQSFFDDAITDTVYTQAPYNARGARDTRNANDRVYTGARNGSLNLWTLTQSGSGYAAALNVAVNVAAPAASLPTIAAGGIANTFSGAAGLTPGSWITIYGANLAAATHTVAASEIANNSYPQTLSGVSVSIDNKPAYVVYVSPTQINVLSPADATTGPVAVTVTNASGTSAAVNVTMQPLLPGLFTASGYIGGTGTAAARPGDVLQIYGTGFGPTNPSIDPEPIFSGAYPTTNPVTVTIGGISSSVSFAGLVAPGLYQLNVTVPAGLNTGDNPVVASIGSLTSQSSALLKITNS